MQWGSFGSLRDPRRDLLLASPTAEVLDPGVVEQNHLGHSIVIAPRLGVAAFYTVWGAGHVHGSVSAPNSAAVSIQHYRTFFVAVWGSSGECGGWLFCRENDYRLYCTFT